MSPFKRLIIHGHSRYYRGANFELANLKVTFYKSNHTTVIKTSQSQTFDSGITSMSIDISDINEQAYFVIIPDPVRSDVYAEDGVGFIVKRIDFSTT